MLGHSNYHQLHHLLLLCLVQVELPLTELAQAKPLMLQLLLLIRFQLLILYLPILLYHFLVSCPYLLPQNQAQQA